MHKHFFFRCEEQQDLIRTLKLPCKYETGPNTYMCKISESDDSSIIVLTLRDDGTILQKWYCVTDAEPITTYENTTVELYPIECNICDDILDDRNIKCYLCEKPTDAKTI